MTVNAALGAVLGAREPAARAKAWDSGRRLPFTVGAADAVVLVIAVFIGWEMRLSVGSWDRVATSEEALATTAGPWIIAGWLLVLAIMGGYSRSVFGAGHDEYRAVLLSSLLTAGAVGLSCYLLRIELSRGFLMLTVVIGTSMLLGERYAARKILHRARAQGRMLNRVVAVGGPSGIAELVEVLHRERYAGFEVVGACVPDGLIGDAEDLPVPFVGSVDMVREACAELGASSVLVARGGYTSSADLRQIVWDLEGSGLEVIVVPSLTDVAGARIRMRPVAGLPLLHVEAPRVDQAGGPGKRVFDVVAAVCCLLVLSPLMLVTAAGIWFQDRGPVLFRQPRIGRQGVAFEMVKFRTMDVDAERRLDEVLDLNEFDNVLFKMRTDPRVTSLGRWLRRFSIDELPQLVNVIRGEMSLVGPRPPLAREVATYEADVRRRLLVRPGMTGLWQVSGRSDLSWNDSVRLDLFYVDNWSLVGDLVIMLKTVRSVLTSRGAY